MLCVTQKERRRKLKLFRKSNESIRWRINIFSRALSLSLSSSSLFNLVNFLSSKKRINRERGKSLALSKDEFRRHKVSEELMINGRNYSDEGYLMNRWSLLSVKKIIEEILTSVWREVELCVRTRKPRKRMRARERERERQRKEGGETGEERKERGKRKARRREQSLIVEFWIRHKAFHLSKCGHYSSFYQF